MDKPTACRLTAHIRGIDYRVRPVAIAPEATEIIRAWHLSKPDSPGYYVADTIHGATCECASFVFRHEGKDDEGCKHIIALRELGLLDPRDGTPESWPIWTDFTAVTVRR